MKTTQNIGGQTFDRWTVLQQAQTPRSRWLCRCSCGKQGIVSTHALTHRLSRSCGCLRAEILRKNQSPGLLPDHLQSLLGIEPDAEVARQANLSRERIRQIRKQLGIPKPPPKPLYAPGDPRLLAFQEIWEASLSVQEVAEQMGIRSTQVVALKRQCSLHGIPLSNMLTRQHEAFVANFIQTWNGASSVTEATALLGYQKNSDTSKIAYSLRRRGHSLKRRFDCCGGGHIRKIEQIEWKGVSHTRQEWAALLGLSYPGLIYRLKAWSLDRALTDPLHGSSRDQKSQSPPSE